MVRCGKGPCCHASGRVQVRVEQKVGQLQAGLTPALPDGLPPATAGPSGQQRTADWPGAHIRVSDGEGLRTGHQQPASAQQRAGKEGQICRLRKGFGLLTRGPQRATGRMDRTAHPPRRRQNLPLRTRSASKHFQSVASLPGNGASRVDAHHAAGRAAQHPRLEAHVPQVKDHEQTAE